MPIEKITVGRKYKDAFESVVKLCEKGAFSHVSNSSDKNFVTVENEEIHAKGKVYTYDDQIVEVVDDVESAINEDGASWFSGFRGKQIYTGDAEWMGLINDIAEKFHAEYSYLEYDQRSETITTEKDNYYQELIKKNILPIFNLANHDSYFKNGEYKIKYDSSALAGTEDIYGMILKLDINSGAGSLQPLICKIYFEKIPNSDSYRPLSNADAESIDSFFSTALSGDEIIRLGEVGSASESIKGVCAALVKLIENQIEGYNFTNCIFFHNQIDQEIINEILAKGSHGIVDIDCQNVKIFTVTHVKWKNIVYNVSVNNKDILQFTFGLNNRLSIKCLSCHDGSILVDNNTFTCINDETNEVYTVTHDFKKPVNSLSDDEKNSLLLYGPFKKHLFKKSCSVARTTNKCTQCICESQMIIIDEDRACRNCPYPEILYTDKFGRKRLTSKSVFVHDSLTLVDEANATKCYSCGRLFENLGGNTRCDLCISTIRSLDEREEKQYKKNYRKYKKMLPVSTRLLSVFNKKYCVEDDELLFIVIGKHRYKFNKLEINDNGYVKNPIKEELK